MEDAPRGRLDDVLVRLDLAGDERFAQAEGGVNHRLAARPGQGVGGEEHAGRLAGDHLLHDDGKRGLAVVNGVAHAVADGARLPQAGPAGDDRARSAPAPVTLR